VAPGVERIKHSSPKNILQIDEHLQIASRCVNLRCEIIDLVRRLSHISGIDGVLSRLACDLGR
jgi:hypothetical protein